MRLDDAINQIRNAYTLNALADAEHAIEATLQGRAGFDAESTSRMLSALLEQRLDALIRVTETGESPNREAAVILTSAGDRQIAVIRAIRGWTRLGLSGARDLALGRLPAKIWSGPILDGWCLVAAIREAGGAAEIQ